MSQPEQRYPFDYDLLVDPDPEKMITVGKARRLIHDALVKGIFYGVIWTCGIILLIFIIGILLLAATGNLPW